MAWEMTSSQQCRTWSVEQIDYGWTGRAQSTAGSKRRVWAFSLVRTARMPMSLSRSSRVIPKFSMLMKCSNSTCAKEGRW